MSIKNFLKRVLLLLLLCAWGYVRHVRFRHGTVMCFSKGIHVRPGFFPHGSNDYVILFFMCHPVSPKKRLWESLIPRIMRKWMTSCLATYNTLILSIFSYYRLIAFDERYLASNLNAVGLQLLATNQIASVTIRSTHLLILFFLFFSSFSLQFKTNYCWCLKKYFFEKDCMSRKFSARAGEYERRSGASRLNIYDSRFIVSRIFASALLSVVSSREAS